MSVFKMYPVHSMRKFVCDRLTAAAQEILGAFETRVENYEAEIARQRRLLDKVFSPEIKLQQTEIPLGEQICQNQLDSETRSRLGPETIKIKDEDEEMCISEDRSLHPQQQQEASVSKLTSVWDPNVSSNRRQPLDPDQQSSVNKDPPSNTSNKDGESGFNRETSTALSQKPGNLCEGENQHLTDGDASTPGHVEPSPDDKEKSSAVKQEETSDKNTRYAEGSDEINNENTTVHKSSEQFSDSNDPPTGVMEPTQELTQLEQHSTETTLAANDEQEQNRMHTREDDTSPGDKGSERSQDESPDLTGTVEPTQSENSQDGRPVLTASGAPTPNEKMSTCPDGTLDLTWEPNNESPDETSNRRPEDKKATLSLKSTQDEKHDDGDAASARDNESTQHEEVNRENTAESMETRSPSDAKNTTTSSKPTHESSGRSAKSRKSKEPTSKRESGARSKKAPSLKRLNEGQSLDSVQRKRHKDGHSTSTNEENELEKTSQGGVTLNEDAEQPPDGSNEGSSGDEKTENPFKCDTCGKVMSNFKNYKFHMKSHTVEKKFKCDTCGKMFRESWDLTKHLVVHSVEKPYKCDTCGNGFNRRYNLDLHVRVHTGEKPYACSMCGKSFSSCVNLKKHTRIHTGEKPYTCKDCGKEFADSSAFKNHMRVHTGEKPFKCTYCKRKFATRTTLKRHTRTHTGEKPYRCTVCDKRFGHRTDLKGHTRMHTGEKPYKCSTCGDQFSNWSKLNKHKRVHVSEPQSSTDSLCSGEKEGFYT